MKKSVLVAMAAATVFSNAANSAFENMDASAGSNPAINTIETEATPARPRLRLGEEQADFALFFGIDTGYSGMGSVPASDFAKDGYDLGLKGLGSLYTGSIVTDLGFGWNYNYMSGNNNIETRNIRTRSAYGELSPRLRLGDNWQIGPDLVVLFGTDNRYPEFDGQQGVANAAIMLGLQAMYEFNGTQFPMRLGAKFLTDLDVANRQIYMAMASFQIGFTLTNTSTVVAEAAPIVQPVVKVTLDEKLVHFKTNKAELTSQSRRFLNELGKNIGNNMNFSNLQVGGHTDDRGTFEYNLQLSLKRAESVKNALIEGGADSRKLESLGYSLTRPLEPGKTNFARSKNRRVELKFNGVDNAEAIKAGVNEAKNTTGYKEEILMD